jgi:DNA-binding XRE family transcriptional regulator
MPKVFGVRKPHLAGLLPKNVWGHSGYIVTHTRLSCAHECDQKKMPLRQTTGMSQAEFAEMMGLTESQYGNFETGHTRIGIDAALALVRELRVNLDWIYLGERAWLPAELKERIDEALANPVGRRARRNRSGARAA